MNEGKNRGKTELPIVKEVKIAITGLKTEFKIPKTVIPNAKKLKSIVSNAKNPNS